ncbi:DUF4245 domain-containing protein [Nocardia farcinica]|uniref:DUF4245 domain-containing protein n=1 Tax=Nocardia farcinica TaxID=37329 RepID=UPI000E021884|nr:DUF4245 domain-containing protein [Nocardia farcinica]MBF6233129.1 DUF4245 domain-containing protein [Nocardia farcinica]MBF6259961.1 DUF4245 domain-containing protein [Nocardia farcinica]MBF6376497.1 DUF4245 domain-containing protein [Nocardia farcinica]MBF6419208.1 DUF4245 domain-containing protein [Nocardia farcinica]MBF6430685.1 DUF4245 domain-containing protein [Nocardia farcinica]
MSYQKPRILHDYRDLFFSLIPLVLIAVVFAGLASQCSFSAQGPTQGQIPHFDVDAALHSDARSLPFPIRNPEVPESWTSNSGSRDTITGEGGGPVSTVGYITEQGTYMRLTQSSATEESLARFVLGSRYAGGAQQIGEQKWIVYAEPTEETAWIADFGDVRVLITGAGDEAAFTTLARAVTAAQPLAR